MESAELFFRHCAEIPAFVVLCQIALRRHALDNCVILMQEGIFKKV
jgi:hypothetical protein